MKWVMTTGIESANVPGVIAIKSPYGIGYVGRTDVVLNNGTYKYEFFLNKSATKGILF